MFPLHHPPQDSTFNKCLLDAGQLSSFTYIMFLTQLLSSSYLTTKKIPPSPITCHIPQGPQDVSSSTRSTQTCLGSPKLTCYFYIHLMAMYFFIKKNGSHLPQRR